MITLSINGTNTPIKRERPLGLKKIKNHRHKCFQKTVKIFKILNTVKKGFQVRVMEKYTTCKY